MTCAEALRILGLEPDATPAEAKRAYRQLVKAVHPDKNAAPNARHLFQLVQEAYEFISTIEEQEQTRERVTREARDRAEREARARAAREWAERETRQKQERERADREKRTREAKEKAAKEAEARKEWKRQRDEAVIGVNGCIGRCLVMPMACTTIPAFIVIIKLGVAISRNGWWIFATFVVAFIVMCAILGIFFST